MKAELPRGWTIAKPFEDSKTRHIYADGKLFVIEANLLNIALAFLREAPQVGKPKPGEGATYEWEIQCHIAELQEILRLQQEHLKTEKRLVLKVNRQEKS